jgi:hypothetical protein
LNIFSKLARSFSKSGPIGLKRAGVSMLLPSWLVSPLDGVVAMLVLLRTFSPSHPAHVETCALPNDEHRLYMVLPS